ncbi:MAG: hypothetical protein H0U59_11510 [Gemmatimonadaceae bacterium]|nr:hypothetical protein [Gemmatimonadaceae bacterium]
MKRSFVNSGHAVATNLKTMLGVTVLGGLLALPAAGTAQLVTPKTVPVLQGGQFDMFPSARAGMGGVTIAVDDTLLDPFVNPAKTTRIGVAHVFGAPYFHSVSGSRGGGRSIPVGGGGSWGDWSATGLFTFQQLDRAGPTWNLSTSEQSAFNQYVAGSIARRMTPSTSIGFGVQLAALDAIDGVDLLYAGSDRIDQSGSLADYRLGFTKEVGVDRHLEVLLLHSRTDMRHDVRFTTVRWDSVGRRIVETQRTDRNEDRTNIWGVHTEYSRPVGSEGWHLGWLGTANRLSHPKIPNYVIQNIPRDPGTTYSYNAGVGIGRSVRGTSFAADLIYEPMFADTWADAANDTAVAGGGTIAAGGKTVENTFRFNNVKMRLGAGRDIAIRREGSTILGIQLGLGLHAINYRLQQANNVLRTFRTQREDWIEWSPTLGLRLRSRDMDLMYNFSLTCGPGSCGQGQGGFPLFGGGALETAAGGGIIAAPSGELFMQSGSLKVHKLTISLPIR